MTIILHVYIKFFRLFQALYQHTLEHEPDTLSYFPSIDPADPLGLYIFEQYADERAKEEVHMRSAPAKELFEPQMWASLTEKLVITKSTPTPYGFTHRP